MLFLMIDQQPHNPGALDFGEAFYRRLEARGDDALFAGNLPRAEVRAGQAQLEARKADAARSLGST